MQKGATLNRRIAAKRAKQAGETDGLANEIASLVKTFPSLHHAVEEVAEDNIALVQAIRRVAENQETQRTVLLQEIDRLRAGITTELVAHSLKNACRELSPVLNALEGMLDLGDFSDAAVTRQHVESVAATLKSALGRIGIEPVPIVVGTDLFDSRIHECVSARTASDSPFPEAADRTIVKVVEPGYTVQGRLALPAKVWVQKLEMQESKQQEKEGMA